jgi:hypothetical protein
MHHDTDFTTTGPPTCEIKLQTARNSTLKVYYYIPPPAILN